MQFLVVAALTLCVCLFSVLKFSNKIKTMVEETDSTSFASILAGVKRMREQASGVESNDNAGGSTNEVSSVTSEVVTDLPPIASSRPDPAPTRAQTISNRQAQTVSTRQANPIVANPSRPIPTTTKPSVPTSLRTLKSSNRPAAPTHILVNKSQVGNPLLTDSLMKTTSWSYDLTLLSDYYINPKLQILFLSLKYHKLRPEYIWTRLKALKGSLVESVDNDMLRILLVVVDIDSHQEVLRTLLASCIKNNLSLVLAWSFEEAGNYVVFAKQQDNSPQQLQKSIRGVKLNQDYNTTLTDVLTSVKRVNKTDVSNLLANYKSFKNIVLKSSREEDVLSISGLGSTKVENLNKMFQEPFIYNKVYEKE